MPGTDLAFVAARLTDIAETVGAESSPQLVAADDSPKHLFGAVWY